MNLDSQVTGRDASLIRHPSNHHQQVLVPAGPDLPTSMIDVRDLALWLVTCAEAGTSGTYNAAGELCRLADHLIVARTVAGHSGPLVAATPGWLNQHEVQMWMALDRCHYGSMTRIGTASTPEAPTVPAQPD